MRAITAIVTPVNQYAYVNMDSWSGAAMGVQVNLLGGAAYQLRYSFDDPNDVTNPIPLANMLWDNAMLPSPAAPFQSITFSMPVSPLWWQVRQLNGLGSSRVTFLQLGIHSRSNIVAVPDDLLVTGPNFAAVHRNGNGA
jgi:hypothetical protein